MEINNHNYLLKSLKTLFNIYSIEEGLQNVTCLFKLLYEKKIVDIKKVDIFQINYFIQKQLNYVSDINIQELITKEELNEDENNEEAEQSKNSIHHDDSEEDANETHEVVEKIKYKDFQLQFKDFLSILFYILIRHMQEEGSDNNNESVDKLSKCLDEGMSPEDIIEQQPEILSQALKQNKHSNMNNITNNNNNSNDNSKISNNNKENINNINNHGTDAYIYDSMNVIQCLNNQESIKYHYCFPNFSIPEISEFINNMEILLEFNDELYTIFANHAKYDSELNVEYINFTELVEIILEKNIFANNNSKKICEVISYYIPYSFDYDSEDFTLIFDDPKISKSKNLIELQLAKFNLLDSELKFNFSTFSLFITHFHLFLKANEGKTIPKSILYYYKVILEFDIAGKFEEKNPNNNLSQQEENEEEEMDEFEKLMKVEQFPESVYMEEAKKIESKPDDTDEEFVFEFLQGIDKDMPLVPIYDSSIKINNGYANTSELKKEAYKKNYSLINDMEALNTESLYTPDGVNLKFPFNTLHSEIEKEKLRKIDIKEKIMIEKAKKPKKQNNNKKELPPKPLDFEDLPDKDELRIRYYGSSKINDLKKRYFKNSFKNIISNTYVYPSIIAETLMIPNKIPIEIKRLIIVAIRNVIKGNFDLGLSQLERAQFEINDIKLNDNQTDLFINLTFGGIFMNLNYFSMAIKFLSNAKFITSNMSNGNPDICLIYCFIGDLLLKMNEPEWALRSYWKAKSLRESCIGGDTLDTATVYNNLGVCFYHLNKYYESHGFFKLAYEIYKEFE